MVVVEDHINPVTWFRVTLSLVGSWMGRMHKSPSSCGKLGYNDYQAVAKQTEGCTNQTPISGFDQEQENNEVPPQSVRESGGGTVETQENAKGQPNNDLIIESLGNNSLRDASKENNETGKVEEPLAKNEDCEPLPTAQNPERDRIS